MAEDPSDKRPSLTQFIEETPSGWFVALLALGPLSPQTPEETLAPQWQDVLAHLGARQAPLASTSPSTERPPSWAFLTQRTSNDRWQALGEVLEPHGCAVLNRTLP